MIDKIKRLKELKLKESDNFWEEYLEFVKSFLRCDSVELVKVDEQKYKELIQRALKQEYAYEKIEKNFVLCVKLDTLKDTIFLIATFSHLDKTSLKLSITKLLCIKDIPIINYKINSTNTNFLGDLISLIDLITQERDFKSVAFRVVDEILNIFDVERVSLGWNKKNRIKIVAISKSEEYSKFSELVRAIESAMEEAFEQNSEIFLPQDENSLLITFASKNYLLLTKHFGFYQFPLRIGQKVVGVLSIESQEELEEKELEKIRFFLNIIAPILLIKYNLSKNIFEKIIDKTRDFLSIFFSPKYTFTKFIIFIVLGSILFISFKKIDYDIKAKAQIATKNLLFVNAPFDGIIKEVYIDEGVKVKKGQKILSYEKEEFILKKYEIESEIAKAKAKMESFRAKQELSKMKIEKAKIDELKVSLKEIDYKLQKATIKSLIDGVVIEGEREKLLNYPSKKGELLVKIVNPKDFYLKIKADEKDINYIKELMKGSFHFIAKPQDEYKIIIKKIIPIAKVDEKEGNIFIVNAKFNTTLPLWVKPGMNGLAKIKAGKKRIIWIWTHRLIDFIHLYILW